MFLMLLLTHLFYLFKDIFTIFMDCTIMNDFIFITFFYLISLGVAKYPSKSMTTVLCPLHFKAKHDFEMQRMFYMPII